MNRGKKTLKTTGELLSEFGSMLSVVRDCQNQFVKIAPSIDYTEKDLIFVSAKSDLPRIKESPPAITIIAADLVDEKQQASFSFSPRGSIFLCKNIRLAHALMKQRYQDADPRENGWPLLRHPSAVIHPDAILAESVRVSPLAVIGPGCKIGENVYIGAGVTIEQDVSIDSESVIMNQVYLGADTKIGQRVYIKPAAVIGLEGFGFAQDAEGRHHRLPQTGNVIIEDCVVIGALNTIDRGTYRSTIIRKGVILDSHVHIAHNCVIGKNSLIAAQTGIAGSADIGANVKMSGQSGVLDHVKVPDDTILVHRALVTRDLKDARVYAYHPIMPIEVALKAEKIITELPRLKKKILDSESRDQESKERAG